jgi:hypothetical protein
MGDFDNFQVLLQEVLKLTMAQDNKSLPDTARNIIAEELSETMKEVDEAHVQLGRLPGKLRRVCR